MHTSSLLLFSIPILPLDIIIQGGPPIGFVFSCLSSTFKSSTLHTNYLCLYNLFVAIPFILNKSWPSLRILAIHTTTLLLNNSKNLQAHCAHALSHLQILELVMFICAPIFFVREHSVQTFVYHVFMSLHLNPFLIWDHFPFLFCKCCLIRFPTTCI